MVYLDRRTFTDNEEGAFVNFLLGIIEESSSESFSEWEIFTKRIGFRC